MTSTPCDTHHDRPVAQSRVPRNLSRRTVVRYMPPEREDEVAASLRWYVEPTDGAVFDSWAPRPVPINQRAVKFSKPGVYRLWATSYVPLDAMSNTLQIRVLPP
jgi:hypothetical protein